MSQFLKLCWLVSCIAPLLLLACSGGEEKGEPDGRLQVATTTAMIADVVRNVAGEHANVVALMGPGVDPHLYKATQGDLATLTGADVVFYNGLHLEGKMIDALEKLGRSRPVIAIAEAIDTTLLRRPPEFEGSYDPHLWFDVGLWRRIVPYIAEKLASIDTAHAADFRRNAAAYGARLDSLDARVRREVATIPKEQRLLITAHDAFGYFGRAYDIEVMGLQGISTVSEAGLADVSALVDSIVSRRVRSLYVESSVPRRSIEAVQAGARARGHEVGIGGTLYSDAMGEEGTPEGTYIGMVEANLRKIVEGLR